jgi:hypothetical protein
MLPKVLAWASLGTALLFVVVTITALVALESLGDTGPLLVLYGGVPLLGISILLAISLLVIAATTSDS